MNPADAAAMNRLRDDDLALEVERRSHSILGKIKLESGRGIFPLSALHARSMAARRIALVGEAAHVIPPIGAQGLNLGLRDTAAIGEIVVDAIRDGSDHGSDDILDAYDRVRRADVGSRTLAVDWLNRSLLTDFLPAQASRGVGLYLLDRIAPLRRAVMREGVTPATRQPRLMRGEIL
jgi:2-octaprenyl-6-methoxyphenol hydroxylase